MKLAIMQPYLFPYIGYFQLINAVDSFVIYDDVNFIKKGWINRNSILVNGNNFLFTAALKEVSQNKLINQIEIDTQSKWQNDLVKTINFSYKKAPYFEEVIPIISDILNQEQQNLASFLTYSLRTISSYLSINTNFFISSEIRKNNELKGQDKIIELCKVVGANQYFNAIGGKELYSEADFLNHNIQLHFIKSNSIQYPQFKNEFIPWLSIIDVLMFNSVEKIKGFLDDYELV
jgi:hypothetical protein